MATDRGTSRDHKPHKKDKIKQTERSTMEPTFKKKAPDRLQG